MRSSFRTASAKVRISKESKEFKQEEKMIEFMTKDGEDIRNIIKTVANNTGISFGLMQDKTRKRQVVVARHLAIYFIRLNNESISLKSIGYMFGNRDHSTIISAIESVDGDFWSNKSHRDKMIEICNEVNPYLIPLLGQLSNKDDRVNNGKNLKLIVDKVI